MDHLEADRVIGLKQSKKAILDKKAKVVMVARDIDQNILEEIKKLCEECVAKVEYMESRNALGKAFGIDVGASIVCILN